jgi:PAS domain S-box-containing protein
MGKWISDDRKTPDDIEMAFLRKRFDHLEALQSEEPYAAARQVLHICNVATNRHELINLLLPFLQRFTNCQAVGLRLRQGDHFPYCATRGFPQSFLTAEKSLGACNRPGSLVADRAHNVAGASVCGDILSGRFDPAQPFFTAGGGFWTNSAAELSAASTATDHPNGRCDLCISAGYQSVALLPLHYRDTTIGLLQCNDREKDRFSPGKIDLLENLVASAAIALARHRADEELRASEKNYRHLVENSPEAIIITQNEYLCLVNPATARLTGYSTEQLLRSPFIEFIHPADRQTVMTYYRKRMRGEDAPHAYSFRLICQDGTVKWLDLHASLIDWQGKAASLNFITDITKRKKNEELLRARLRLSEAAATHDLKSLLQKIIDEAELLTGSCIGLFYFFNDGQQAMSLQAWSTATTSICTGNNQRTHYPLDKAGVWADCIRQGRAIIHNDYAALNHRRGMPANHVVLVRELTVPVIRHGKIVALMAVGNKDTDYNQEDIDLVTTLANLAWDIVLRKRAEDALRDSLAEKEVLLREVHHRVKNNMAAIIGLFEMQRQAMDDPGARTILAELSSRVRAMSLVHEKLYRSTSLARVDFQDYCHSLISHLRNSFSPLFIRCEIAALEVTLPLDLAVPCGIIINELVTNALKYAFPDNIQNNTNDGKGDSGRATYRILVSLEHQDDIFTLTVADNGVGLPPGYDWSTAKTMGLTLVRMLGQHQLGGRYQIDNTEGTTFTLIFPVRNRRKNNE